MANLNNYKEYFEDEDLEFIEFFKGKGGKGIKYRCKKHGVLEQRFSGFIGCKKCNRENSGIKISEKQKDTYENVVKYINENSNAKLISKEYKLQRDDYWFECECGNGFRTSLNSFKQKNKRICDVCAEEIRVGKRQHSEEYIIEYVKEMSNLKFLRYFRNKENGRLYVVLECECGEEIETVMSNLKHFKMEKCEKCRYEDISSIRRRSIEEINNILKTWGLITTSEEYKNPYTDLEIHCECGHTFTDKMQYISTRHKKCPKCALKLSIGAKKIYDFLINNNIEFEMEKPLDGCIYKSSLFFDFYLPEYNILIEFDGEFHYINHSTKLTGFDSYLIRKKCDYLKNKYCRKNSDTYKLIRIPYWEVSTINKYLENLLKR